MNSFRLASRVHGSLAPLPHGPTAVRDVIHFCFGKVYGEPNVTVSLTCFCFCGSETSLEKPRESTWEECVVRKVMKWTGIWSPADEK